jgi:hypothetical protein
MQMEPKEFNKLADLGFAIGDIKDGKTITNEDELKEANREILNSADIDSQEILHVQKFEFVDNLDFGKAIEALKRGHLVRRKGWNGKGMWLKLQGKRTLGIPLDGNNTGTMLPFIAMKVVGNSKDWGEGSIDLVPWLASQTDMLAEDWEIIIE